MNIFCVLNSFVFIRWSTPHKHYPFYLSADSLQRYCFSLATWIWHLTFMIWKDRLEKNIIQLNMDWSSVVFSVLWKTFDSILLRERLEQYIFCEVSWFCESLVSSLFRLQTGKDLLLLGRTFALQHATCSRLADVLSLES